VLVTGASGFIGRWVARLLTSAGAELYLPVRDCAAASSTFAEYEIRGKIFKLDLLDFDRLQRSIGEICPAITFNLAGYGIDRSEQSEQAAHDINAVLPEKLCEAVARAHEHESWQGSRLVHAGTAMEYGAITGDLREDSVTQPTSLYGRSKLAGTEAVVSFCENKPLRGVTARLFGVYGPGESPVRLLPTLIAAASIEADRIELTAGLHKRDLTYVEDVAEALLRIGVSDAPAGDVVNVATGTLTSIRSFVETAAKVLGLSEHRLDFGALETRAEEMAHDPVNIGRLFELTGWKPGTGLEDGILRTLRRRQDPESFRPSAKAQEAICGLF
jgi:nucleoside-diphosphate-sugar epimerase